MARCVLLDRNRAETATLSGPTSGDAWTNLNNLKTRRLGEVARSSSAALDVTWLACELGRVRPLLGVALCKTNSTPGSGYRWRFYNSSSDYNADPDVDAPIHDSGTLFVPGSTVDSMELPWGDPGWWLGLTGDDPLHNVDLWYVIPEGSEGEGDARYVRIDIGDDGNADGYVQAGYLVVAEGFRPSINYAYGNNNVIPVPLIDTDEALDGTEYFNRRGGGKRRTLKVSFDYLDDETEAFDRVATMAARSLIDTPMYMVQDPDDTEHQQRTFLCRFATLPGIEQAVFERSGTAFDVREWL